MLPQLEKNELMCNQHSQLANIVSVWCTSTSAASHTLTPWCMLNGSALGTQLCLVLCDSFYHDSRAAAHAGTPIQCCYRLWALALCDCKAVVVGFEGEKRLLG